MSTLAIIDAIVARLKEKIPQIAVEFFPERPAEYRLNHPRGALLISYPGASYKAIEDAAIVVQERELGISVTVVMRQLNGKGGAIAVLDELRAALLGFTPPDCRKLKAAGDKFIGEVAGLWQYQCEFRTLSMAIEAIEE